jgi:hypothetical protein
MHPMVNILNFILIQEHITPNPPVEIIENWLEKEINYNRLQAQCDKIWNNYSVNPQYDAERAFQLLSKRFLELCYHEQNRK